jgi:hypothetical protein
MGKMGVPQKWAAWRAASGGWKRARQAAVRLARARRLFPPPIESRAGLSRG